MTQTKKDIPQIDEQTYIKNTKAMQKMQEIADRLALTTPELSKFINPESILKPSKMMLEQQLIPVNKKQEILDQKNKKKNVPTAQQITNKNEMTPIDWQRKCNELQVLYQKEQDQNKILTIELNNRQERFVKREMEYRKIIEELQSELRSKTTLDQGDRKVMEAIYKDHAKIVDGINSIQERTSKILVDQERDIIRFFNNKINEIKKQFEEERIKKGKKVPRDQDYIEKENQLISELEWIKNIAQKIDNENHSLMKKYVELKAQYQTQENDREMLLKELIMKKKKNAILKSQIEQYEKLLNDVQKEEEEQADDDQSQSRQQAQIRIRPLSKKSQVRGISGKKDEAFTKNFSGVNSQDNFGTSQASRFEKTIKLLQSNLRREQKRVRDIKALYIKEMHQKSELEKILRKCVDDIKQEIIQMKGELKVYGKKQHEELFDRNERDKLIDRLLNNEKILTLLYDKTFYPDLKKMELGNEEYESRQGHEVDPYDENIEDQF